MDISSSNPTQNGAIRDMPKVHELDQAQRRVREGGYRRGAADEAIISDRAQLLKKLGEAVRDSSEVREDRVAELRTAIEQGRYQVSEMEIAKAILASRAK